MDPIPSHSLPPVPTLSHGGENLRRNSRRCWWWVWLVVSLLVHVALLQLWVVSELPEVSSWSFENPLTHRKSVSSEEGEVVVDVIQEPQDLKEPPETSRLGHRDHQAQRETVLAVEDLSSLRGTDIREEGGEVKGSEVEVLEKVVEPSSTIQEGGSSEDLPQPEESETEGFAAEGGERTPYEALLSRSADSRGQLARRSYGAYLEDEKAEKGRSIDLSTKEFRWMGYFSKLKKAIHSTWSYPRLARAEALRGKVKVEFVILKDGSLKKVKVVSSSGYAILDRQVVKALKEAAPFDPLPWHYKEPYMKITGLFTYLVY